MHSLKDYGLTYKTFKVLCDNMNTINLTKNLIYHLRTKHIEMKYYFIKDQVVNGDFVRDYVELKAKPSRYIY